MRSTAVTVESAQLKGRKGSSAMHRWSMLG
jgi:hypothetical protein